MRYSSRVLSAAFLYLAVIGDRLSGSICRWYNTVCHELQQVARWLLAVLKKLQVAGRHLTI